MKEMHLDKEPLVSVIMPLYNCEQYVLDAINSVTEQTYINWELIVVDDQSSDNSYSIVKRIISTDKRLKLYRLKHNMGSSHARNHAIEIAKGKYIAFLDSDDVWLPDKLEKQITFMEQENVLLSYSSYYVIDAKGETIGIFHANTRVTYNEMLKTSTIGTLTTVYNAEKLGKFYFQDIGHEDYVMKLKIIQHAGYAKGLKEPLAKYRIAHNSLSRNKLKAAYWQWKIYREVEHLSFLKSVYYFIHYVYFGLKKYA